MSAHFVAKRKTCRACGSRRLTSVIDLGVMPLANAFVRERSGKREHSFPLAAHLCSHCSFLQLRDVVSPRLLFSKYLYTSSTSPVFEKHFEHFAIDAFKRGLATRGSFIIDIGSNDGILLAPFKKRGARVLGIEPASSIARAATKNGIPTRAAFFSLTEARKIEKRYGKADLITATNVFAHVDDIADFVRGVRLLLQPGATFVIEVPYVADLIRKNLFDTIYHEHLSYFNVRALHAFFSRSEMCITDIQRVPTHGGSLRVFVRAGNSERVSGAVRRFLAFEKRLLLGRKATYDAFMGRIRRNKKELRALLRALTGEGKRVAGYGAPAKGNTMLNTFSIGPEHIIYIVDDSPLKQGLLTPGMHIPVVHPRRLRRDPPDYLMLMAWNFADSIMRKNAWFKKRGGRFIIPVPRPSVI